MFLVWKNPKMSPKTGPKSQKNVSGPPQISEKKTCGKPKKWIQKIWPRFGGRVHEHVRSVLFFTVFFEGERQRPIKNRRFLPKKGPPPQVNLNLSWLMPSGWSRPLHLRCRRISAHLGLRSGHPLCCKSSNSNLLRFLQRSNSLRMFPSRSWGHSDVRAEINRSVSMCFVWGLTGSECHIMLLKFSEVLQVPYPFIPCYDTIKYITFDLQISSIILQYLVRTVGVTSPQPSAFIQFIALHCKLRASQVTMPPNSQHSYRWKWPMYCWFTYY